MEIWQSEGHTDRLYFTPECNGLVKLQKCKVVPKPRLISFVLVVYDSFGDVEALRTAIDATRRLFVCTKMYDAAPVAIEVVISAKLKLSF